MRVFFSFFSRWHCICPLLAGQGTGVISPAPRARVAMWHLRLLRAKARTFSTASSLGRLPVYGEKLRGAGSHQVSIRLTKEETKQLHAPLADNQNLGR